MLHGLNLDPETPAKMRLARHTQKALEEQELDFLAIPKVDACAGRFALIVKPANKAGCLNCVSDIVFSS